MATLRLIVACAVALAGCYDIPYPECGFACGPAALCPDGYQCLGDRCRLSTDHAFSCPEIPEPPDLTAGPEIRQRIPGPGETNVPLDSNIVVTFDEDVSNVTNLSFYVSEPDGRIVGSVTGGALTYVFEPDHLLTNTLYTVTVTEDIQNYSGYRLEATTWSFTTVTDTIGPRVTGSTPFDGATGVATTAQLFVGFDEEVVAPAGSIRLETGGVPVPTTLSMQNPSSVRIVYTPPLAEQTLYTIVVTAAVTDIDGNPATPSILSFTTRDDSRPTAVTRVPMPAAVGVALDATVQVTFSEDVLFAEDPAFVLRDATLTAVPAVYDFDTTTHKATLFPLAPLAPATTYTVELTVDISDLAGNSLAPESWMFTTL